MRRYIDADKIICRLNDEIVHGIDIDTHPVEFGGYLGLLSAKSIIESMLAADVQEVRHGHWNTVNSKVTQCSVCRFRIDIRTQLGWNFCPVCGAKMGEEEHNVIQ